MSKHQWTKTGNESRCDRCGALVIWKSVTVVSIEPGSELLEVTYSSAQTWEYRS